MKKPEILDIVDENDRVVGHASYEKIHAEKLHHRVVHALIINNNDEVLLQLRAASKKAFPLHWSFSVGGHVRRGETYEKALIREAEEEAGIILLPEDITLKGNGSYVDELGHKVLYKTFEIHFDGPIDSENEEVAAMQFVSWTNLQHMIEEKKEKIQSEFVKVIQKHWAKELTSGLS